LINVDHKWLPGQNSFDVLKINSVTTVETFCFFLRNLPFGFLTQHVVGLFLPPGRWNPRFESCYRENWQTTRPMPKKHGPFVCWLPFVDEFGNFLMSEDANIVLEQIEDF